MSRLLDELRGAGNLKAYWNFRSGSLLDLSGNGNHMTTVSGSPRWIRTQKGNGVYVPQAGSVWLSCGNPLSLQLTTATLLVAVCKTDRYSANAGMFYRPNAFNLAFRSTNLLGAYDYVSHGWSYSSYTDTTDGIPRLFTASFQSGVTNGTGFFVNGMAQGTITFTLSDQTQSWYLGGDSIAGQGLGGSVLIAGVVNRVLTGPEHSRLYDEWLSEGFVGDCPRRNFVQVPDPKPDWDYNAQGIVLDTRFERRSDGKIRDDSPSNYAGTVAGACPSGPDVPGIVLPTAAANVSWGNVTQLNSVAAFSIEWWGAIPAGNIPAAYLIDKTVDSSNNVRLGCPAASATSKVLQLDVSTGAAGSQYSSATQIRAGTRQHLLATYSAGSVALNVDGETVASASGGALPATTANLAAANLLSGGNASQSLPCRHDGHRIYTAALTAAQARAAYLKHLGQRLIWRETFEDVPVTLAASVGVGAYIGQVRVISGTWKCSETTDGKRWLECVTVGGCVLPQTEGFGTVHYKQLHHSVAGATYVMFMASLPAVWNATGQNGYLLEHNTSGRLVLDRETSGPDGDAFYTVGNYVANDVVYDYWINRRPSDGRFTAYIQGGAFTKPTLIDPTGGAGTNPTASDVTYTTSKYMSINMAAGDKLLMWDPTPGARYGIEWWAGVLDPTKGEV